MAECLSAARRPYCAGPSLDHAECIGGMRAAGSTCPRSGTAAAGAGRAVRLACGGYTVSHPARHGVCGLSQVAGIGLCRAVRRSTRSAAEVAQIGGAVGHPQHVALVLFVANRRAAAVGRWEGHERRLSRARQPSDLPRVCL